MKSPTKSTLMPLAVIWLALHAALLALILGVKFLTAKALVLVLLMAGAVLFLLGRRKTLTHIPAP